MSVLPAIFHSFSAPHISKRAKSAICANFARLEIDLMAPRTERVQRENKSIRTNRTERVDSDQSFDDGLREEGLTMRVQRAFTTCWS